MAVTHANDPTTTAGGTGAAGSDLMRAIRLRETGGPEVLQLETAPIPAPGPGQALVRIEVSGVNYIDVRQRTGDFKSTLPVIAGYEGAGTIVGLGPDTEGFAVGQRVASQMVQGTYATHQLAPVAKLIPLPDQLDSRTATAVLLQGVTAHALGTSAYPLKSGDVALVQSVSSGIGGILTTIAHLRGARVIGTVSSPDKVDRAREVGADEVIVRSEADFVEKARRLTGGRGVDVVYDGVGRETFEHGLEALRPLGTFVLFGQSSGAVPPLDTHVLQKGGGRYLTRVNADNFVNTREELLRRANELFAWVADGTLNVTIGATFPLEEAGAAQAALTSRATTGKILLDIV